MKYVLIFVTTTLLFAACGTEQKQETKPEESDHQIEAPTEQMSVEAKVTKARALIKEAKRELRLKEEYNCCIETECNTCLLEHIRCDCYDSLVEDKEVCNECYAGWQRGDGVDPDIDKKKVRTSYGGHDHSGHKH